jgi:hypothetical protein
MKKSILNSTSVKPLFNENMKATHEKELGFKIPKDYFSNSKKEILNQVSASKVTLLYRKKSFILSIAAAIALLITLTVFKPSVFTYFNKIPAIASDTINQFKSKQLARNNFFFNVDDVSIAVLFVEDDQIDDFLDDYVIGDVIKDVSIKN